MTIKAKTLKMSSESVAISVFSIMLVLVIVFNIIVGAVVLRMKRQNEEEAVDRKRHIDVLHASIACLNVLGACLVYPTLIIQVLKTNSGVCTFLTSTAAFYMSCTAVLITAINIHSLYSSLRPFHYFTYLRKRNSKIPFAFVLLSVIVGIVNLVLSVCDYSLFRLKPGFYFGIPACIPELRKSAVVYYFVAMIHVVFWFNVVLLVEDLMCIPTCRNSESEEGIFGGGTDYCGWRTRGACFRLMRIMLYIISWSPFTVVSTMIVSGYDVSNDVIVTSCYVMLVPAGLVLPIVFYVTHHDWREVFYECLNDHLARIRCSNERDHAHPANNAEAMELQIVR